MQTSILVVEPDGYTADHLALLFRDNGYSVHHDRTGREGLESLRARRPDVAFIDLYLPDMDGRQFLAEATAAGLETRVLMVSGRKNLPAVVECMKLGATDFLEKPFHPETFWISLRRAEDRLRLEREVRRLRHEVERGSPYQLLFGRGRRMRDMQAIVDQIADTDITVLLRGESGTGKDLFARTIWECSRRRKGRFVKVNCAALPRDLLESELFGYEQGAFTGAHQTKQGKFEYAADGTIFLDEITEMHIDLQAKLLHVLQDAEVCRVGGKEPVPIDVRVIAASNRQLEEEIREKRFRSDLFYRLNVVSIHIPPLRERCDEIPHLVEHFLEKFREQYRRPDARVPAELIREMQDHLWPGNIRELENYMKRIVVVGDLDGVRRELRTAQRRAAAAAKASPEPPDGLRYVGRTLKEVAKEAAQDAERTILAKVLEATHWNRKRASERLDISYKALLYKIREAGLE